MRVQLILASHKEVQTGFTLAFSAWRRYPLRCSHILHSRGNIGIVLWAVLQIRHAGCTVYLISTLWLVNEGGGRRDVNVSETNQIRVLVMPPCDFHWLLMSLSYQDTIYRMYAIVDYLILECVLVISG